MFEKTKPPVENIINATLLISNPQMQINKLISSVNVSVTDCHYDFWGNVVFLSFGTFSKNYL